MNYDKGLGWEEACRKPQIRITKEEFYIIKRTNMCKRILV
jgi:hypothetical protein